MMNRIFTCLAIAGISLAGAACQSTSTASDSDFSAGQQMQPNDKRPAAPSSANASQDKSFNDMSNDADNPGNAGNTPDNLGTNLNGNTGSASEQ